MPEYYPLIGNKFYGEGFGQEHFFSRRGDSFLSQAKIVYSSNTTDCYKCAKLPKTNAPPSNINDSFRND